MTKINTHRPAWAWKPLALSIAIAFASPQGMAQVAAVAGGAGVSAALNGVPLVNIVTPNGAGVSHNKYNQFNVGTQGLILNNATSAAISQLGGAILANPNLTGPAAKVIINEVVQANRSNLFGFVEVAGQRADVVIANPAGITCGGCGFINTPRVTLTTGTPNLDGAGNLSGFTIRSGDIVINGTGLDATGQDYFDILTRALTVNGQINAHDLNIMAGAGTYDYASRTTTAGSGDGAAPVVAIDSSALGGMYSDRIRLVVNEAGAGVRLMGDVAASVADIAISAAGKIQLLGNATAQNNLSVQYAGAARSDAISVGGAGTSPVLYGGGNVSIDGGGTGGAILAGGKIVAGGNFDVTVASLADSGSSADLRYAAGTAHVTTGAASFDGTTWNGGAGLSLDTASFATGANGAGFFSTLNGAASQGVTIATHGDLALGKSSVSGGTDVSLTSVGGKVSLDAGGSVESGANISLVSSTGVVNAGKLSAAGDISLTASAGSMTYDVTNLSTGKIGAGGALNASYAGPIASSFTNNASGEIVANQLNIAADSLHNAGGLQGTHGSNVVVDSFTNDATGMVVLSTSSADTSSVAANTFINSGSTIDSGQVKTGVSAGGNLTLTLRDLLTNNGNLVAGGDLFVTDIDSAHTLAINNGTSQSLMQAGGNLHLQAPGSSSRITLLNAAGAKMVGGSVNIAGLSLDNAGTLEASQQSALDFSNDITNRASGLITLSRTAGSNSTINANNLVNQGAGLSAGAVTSGIQSAGNVNAIVDGTLTNTGNFVSGGDLSITRSSNASTLVVDNSAATSLLKAGGNLSLEGGNDSNNLTLLNGNSGTSTSAVIAGRSLDIKSNSLTNYARIQGGTAMNITVAGAFTNSATGLVIGTTSGAGSGSAPDNATGTITAYSIANNGNSVAGNTMTSGIESFGGLALNARDSFVNNGMIQALGNVALAPTNPAAATTFTNNASIASARKLSVNGGTAMVLKNNNSSAQMYGNQVDITSGVFTNKGLIQANNTVAINSADITNSSTSAIYSGGNMTIASGGAISNSGDIISGGTMSLAATGNIYNYFNWLGGPADGYVLGRISAGGDLTVNSPSSFLFNFGFIDSTHGNINMDVTSFSQTSIAPPIDSSTANKVQLIDGTYYVVDENTNLVSLHPTVYPFDFHLADEFQFAFQNSTQFSPLHRNYFYRITTGTEPANAVYQDFNAYAIKGQSYDRAPVQAHTAAAGNVTIDSSLISLYGSSLSAGGDMLLRGPGDGHGGYGAVSIQLAPMSINNQTVWLVNGQDQYFCPANYCATHTIQDMIGGVYIDDLDLQENYRDYWLNNAGRYTLTQTGTGSLITLSSVIEARGQQGVTSKKVNGVDAAAGQNYINASGVNGLTILNGTVLLNNPGDMIMSLPDGTQIVAIKPIVPLAQPVGQATGAAGANAGTTPAGTALPAAAFIAAGINLSLPTNPNGLFVINHTPGAKYLVETNPKYTSYENIEFGSDYLVKKLGYDPDAVMQRLGDAAYESELITQQIARQTGRTLLKTSTNLSSEVQTLLDNAAWAAGDMHLTLGVALTLEQINALKQDMVWMVQAVVDGKNVLVPVVYLTSATRANSSAGAQIAASNMAVSGGSSFVNMGGAVDVAGNLSIQTSGNIVNTAGTISGGNVTLTSLNGDVLNTTTVTRYGNADNYTDMANKAAIVSTGNLSINAGQGNIISTGAAIRSGGDATLNAGGDVRLNAVVLENKTTESRSTSGILGIGSSSRTTTTINQNAVGSDLGSGGNLIVNAGRDLTLTGSQASAAGDVNVNAQGINVLNAETNSSKTTVSKSSGFYIAGDNPGASSQSSGSMGMQTTTNTNTESRTDIVASGITSGRNTTLTGRDSITVKGSDVNAGGDLTVDTKRLVTSAAANTRTVDTTSTTSQQGVYFGGNADSVSAGAQTNNTDSSTHDFTSTARVSTLNAGGNLTLDSQNNPGGTTTISQEGTAISAGGNFSQNADTIAMTAARNIRESTSNSETVNVRAGAQVQGNFQSDYNAAANGGVPAAAAPSAQATVSAQYTTTNSSSASDQGVAGSIRAGGNINSTSSGNTTFEGTALAAGGNTTLSAGSLDFKAVTNTASNSSSRMTAGGAASAGVDATGSATGSVSANYGNSSSESSSTTQRGGSVTSGGSTTIVTAGDANLVGTNLRAGGDTTIAAGGQVNFSAATDTSSARSSSESVTAGVDASKGSGAGASKSGSVSAGYADANSSSSSTTERGGSIASGGNVTVRAGTGQDLTMVGTDIAAGGDVALSGTNVNLRAAESTATSTSSSLSAGGSVGMETSTKGTKAANFADADKGGKSASGQFSTGSSTDSSSSQRGAVITGQNVTVTAANDLGLQGTVMGASQTANVSAGGNLNMQSAQDTRTSSSGNIDASAGFSKGESAGFNAGAGVADASSQSVVNRNSTISGSNVNVNVGGDATLAGANIAGGNVTTNVGGNLSVESRADVNKTSNSGFGGYLGITAPSKTDTTQNSIVSQRGELAKTGVAVTARSLDTSVVAVTQQSGIQGTQSATVNVTGNTALTGARIASDNGPAVLNTASLTTASVAHENTANGFDNGIGARIGDMRAPTASRTDSSSSVPALASSVGGPPIQATVNVAQLGVVLNQPAVQTAMVLNRGMKAAAAQYGSADQIPAPVVRKLLSDAGVNLPSGANAAQLATALKTTIDGGKAIAARQLAGDSATTAQVDSVLKAVNLN